QAVKSGIPSKHVLFDCWFSFPVTIIEITKLKLNVVARLKKSPKIKYLVGSEKKTLSQIYSSLKKRRGKSKYLLSVPVKLYNKENETIDARIVYVRDRHNKKNWIALISTDMSLAEEEVIQLYGKRWDIEVFFKICKSYLNLGAEFQGLSYDAMTAHTAVVLTRYMILALEKRQNEDPRSLGELFFLCYDEVADIQFTEALGLILSLIRNVLEECLFLTNEQINQLIDTFIAKLPDHFRGKMLYQNVS
ncbi:MAG: transposase, partial [Clostridiaceae bacterium]|nr:transposase [Clostridiaceae bacterium]